MEKITGISSLSQVRLRWRQRQTLMRTLVLSKDRLIAASMFAMQIAWISAIWLTGASTNWQKLLVIGVYSVLCGILILFISPTILEKLRDYLQRKVHNDRSLLLAILSFVLVIGSIYVFEQRIWPWDEEYSFYAAQMIAERGLEVFLQFYSQILWLHHHPPLIPLINGFALSLFGTDLAVLRMISLFFALGTVFLTYLLGRRMIDRQTGLFAAIMIATFPLFFRLGTAALLDIQVTFFFALSMYLFYVLLDKPRLGPAVLLGLIVGAGLLTKYTMFFIFPVIAVIFLSNRKYWATLPYLTLAVVIAGIIFVVWMWLGHSIGVSVPGLSLVELLQQSPPQTISPSLPVEKIPPGKIVRIEIAWFLTHKAGIKFLINSFGTKFTSAIGPYNLPILLLGLLYTIRRRTPREFYLLLWIFVLGICLVVTIPDHRYFMPMFPALAIMIAYWLKTNTDIYPRAVSLSILYMGSALYLFADWFRVAQLFPK